jgi:dephospho-CoA kinase
MPGSGKTTAARILKAHGFTVIEMGAFVRRLMVKEHVPVNSVSLRRFSSELRAKHGPAAVAKLAGRVAQSAKGDVAIIGIRSPSEIRSLKEQLGQKVSILAISTPTKERYERLEERARSDDAAMKSGLVKRDRIEAKWGIRNAISMADMIISNEGSKKEFERNIVELVELVRRAGSHKRRRSV